MNSFKTILLAAGGLALTHSLSAQTVIYIAGSNGDRTATNTAIPKLFDALPATQPTFVGNNSTPTSANYGIWKNGSVGGIPVTIKVSFIGATGAIKALAGNLAVSFLPDSATGTSANNDPTDPSKIPSPDNHIPSFILSSNFQGTSPYQGLFEGVTYQALDDQLTGVIPLKVIGSPGFPGTNITTQQAQLLYSSGAVPVALFTNDVNDKTKWAYAIGRNTDAGQRYIVLAEAGLGVNAVVKQFQPTYTASSQQTSPLKSYKYGGTVASQALWPIETVSGVDSQFPGNSGFTTGSDLAPALTTTLTSNAYTFAKATATAGYYIGYLTSGDADTRVLGSEIPAINRGVELQWNGVTNSNLAIQQGKYTLWAYSHILRQTTLTSGTIFNYYTALKNQITSTDAAAAGILLSTMNVKRTGEGTPVFPTY